MRGKFVVLNEYPKSHHYFETYSPEEELFCPNCGSKGALWSAWTGDYYVGAEYICTACKKSSYLDGAGKDSKPSVVEQLTTMVAHTPTTKRGN